MLVMISKQLSGVLLTVTFLTMDIRTNGRWDQDPNRAILPTDFKVYVKDHTVVNQPYEGFEEKILPTVNEFIEEPGCYVACYSHQKDGSIYSVGDGIYVMGQVRASGSYVGRICRPQGYESANISAEPQLRELCTRNLLHVCKGNSCWAGGDTGGWFGIP